MGSLLYQLQELEAIKSKDQLIKVLNTADRYLVNHFITFETYGRTVRYARSIQLNGYVKND